MTNQEIIFLASQKLAEEGLIKYTGRTLEGLDNEGNKVLIRETEEIHTYQHWQELGYQVQKGQKAVAQFNIWKHTGKKAEKVHLEDGKEATVIDNGHMFQKKASFFSRSQVKAIA